MKSELSGALPLPRYLIASIFSVATLLVAVPSLAQGNAAASTPITRAQVKAELRELEEAGYNPRDWYHYPQNIQAAERIVQQRHEALAQREAAGATQEGAAATADKSYGGNAAAKSGSGAATKPRDMRQHDALPCSMDPQCGLFRGS